MSARQASCPASCRARTTRTIRLACSAALVVATVIACALGEGERFGRAGARSGVLRVHVPVNVVELDPPRARTSLERAIARQLFATPLDAGGRPRLANAVVRSTDGRTVTLTLEPSARFSDGAPLDADAVVWSWRRALLRSTGTSDVTPFWTMENGRALAEGRLLRVVRATTGRAAPFTRLGEPPAPATSVALTAGSMVRVLDSNERKPCCGSSVTLRREPDAGDALGALHDDDVGTVLGPRIAKERSFLLVRSPTGASGWAEQGLLAVHVSPASLVRGVDRDDGSAALRTGPDEDAPVRERLADDAVVETLGEAEGWFHAVDVQSGQMGFIPQRAVEQLRGERQWVQVERDGDDAGAGPRAWVLLGDLAFDPSALGARAVDAVTVEIDCATDADALIEALAHPAMAPVPAQVIAGHGRAWTDATSIVTSGPFTLAPPQPGRLTLVRSASAFEHARARLERIELITLEDPISALHLYRAGELDVLLTVPAELLPVLARAGDFVASAAGGGMVAPEVRGLDLDRLDLRDVEVGAP